MEWLEGEDLATRLRRGPLGVEESQRLVTRAAEALGVAHSRGIVHRDIKPSNLFLTADGDIKVIDFGIARTATVALDMTRTGMILGTPGYLAPEQARRGARALDARADVFALGCVLFECLTGQPAFSGDNPLAILSRVLLEEVPAVSTLRADVPPALDVLLSQMLDKDPDNRPPNGAEVARRWSGCCGRVRRLWRRWRRGGTRRSR
jgi:serine/threonine protein kinase